MAADILLRTERTEYTSGDTIHGAVYLKISDPTSAHGVFLRFFGYEAFSYENKRDLLIVTDDDGFIRGTKEYLASERILLYQFEDPIASGQYVFPFQKHLPLDLPGSTVLKSSSDNDVPHWNVEIVYGIEALLMGAENVKTVKNLVITQTSVTLSAHSDDESGVATSDSTGNGFSEAKTLCLNTWLPLATTETTICIYLDNQRYYAGDNLRLKIDIITNGLIKPKIDSISFQLLRDLRITFKTRKTANRDSGISSKYQTWSWFSPRSTKSDEELTAKETLPLGYVHPEGASHVVWSSRLIGMAGTNLDINGVKELLVPLKDVHGSDVAATTLGSHIWLMYSVKVTVRFLRNDPVILYLPVCTVCQKDSPINLKPCDWIYDCQIMTTAKSQCNVSREILDSVEFSSFPSFHVI